jgi:hypothetical protein
LLEDVHEDRDIVIMGDFNSTYGDDPETVLESGGLMQYLDHQRTAPTIMHFDTPIDQFCVTKAFREVQRNSFVSHHVPDAKERVLWRKTYSDHFPVTLRMTPLADDDPESTFRKGPAAQVLPTTRRRPPAAKPDAVKPDAVSQWPPKQGSMIMVRFEGFQSISGKLIRMPLERGWVVIETAVGIRAFNMEFVRSIEVSKQ